MDLDEYIFYRQREDKNFTRAAFAKKLGITPQYLSRILGGSQFSPAIALKIEAETEGKVNGFELLKMSTTKKGENNESRNSGILPAQI